MNISRNKTKLEKNNILIAVVAWCRPCVASVVINEKPIIRLKSWFLVIFVSDGTVLSIGFFANALVIIPAVTVKVTAGKNIILRKSGKLIENAVDAIILVGLEINENILNTLAAMKAEKSNDVFFWMLGSESRTGIIVRITSSLSAVKLIRPASRNIGNIGLCFVLGWDNQVVAINLYNPLDLALNAMYAVP